MRRPLASAFAAVLIALCVSGCGDVDEVTRVERLGGGGYYDLSGAFDVEIVAGDSARVTIAGDELAVGRVTVRYRGDTVAIDDGGGGSWLQPGRPSARLRLEVPRVRYLFANGGPTVRGVLPPGNLALVVGAPYASVDLTLADGNLFYYNSGASGGEIHFRGAVDRLGLYNFAAMTVDASELEARWAQVLNRSLGEVTVRVSDTLSYRIAGPGDILLYGRPTEIAEPGSTGEGRLARQ